LCELLYPHQMEVALGAVALRLLQNRHATGLPRFGTAKGMLRHLWKLAEPPAHARRSSWLVLPSVLSRM
jgi:hypothetical protein